MENETHSAQLLEDQKFCLEILTHISSTFSVVITELVEPLRTTVCVFYLMLRCLDIIEDDTTLNDRSKKEALKSFSSSTDELKLDTTFLKTIKQNVRAGCNKYYVDLVENFDKVWRVYKDHCTHSDKETIRKIVVKMACGMMKYSNQPIESIADYNEYCYYVSGLVGVGLTELFQSNGCLNAIEMNNDHLQHLVIATGILLQKFNVLRDTYEDIKQEHFFYPKEVWSKYVEDIRNLIDENYQSQAVKCLNDLINDAFQHLPESIEYLSLLTEKNVFRLTAIPLCMSIGTFEKMFNNPAVYNSTVKLDRIEKRRIFESVIDMDSCLQVMETFLTKFLNRTDSESNNWILESMNFIAKFRLQNLQE